MVMSTRCSEEDDEAERCRELVLGSIDLAGKLAVATMLGRLKKLVDYRRAHQQSKYLKKLKEEIESIVETKRLVEDSDIPNLHYLEAVVKETLRLHPTIPGEDCKIGGFDIPKENAVVINAYSIMRDPNFWENPNEFCPERFLQEQDNNQKEIKGQNFSFLPFGGGRRLCPGSHLAFSIIPITIASMVQCFDWKFAGKEMEIIRLICKLKQA
ncbi:hypothetical protein GH714_003481 [Hevea brasiliensis]|uniref:Cytochrome P450 n=1 Tax=Hevea brasiliensis TaxID=3981 RepID=A0A6A6KYK9_HEVBR|nr:hypothetical protein GH714_003481 [Hevea brasiliensis]